MTVVFDTNVLVAAMRSPQGASAELLRRVLSQQILLACSVTFFMEYESVLLRQEHLDASKSSANDVHNVLNTLAGVLQPVDIHYLWRPCLRDANDDMVLETAVNGQASTIVTSNARDFLPHSHSFGIVLQSPKQFLQGLNHGNT
jgi:putative PIN family toxin of toxin-antitoxin system